MTRPGSILFCSKFERALRSRESPDPAEAADRSSPCLWLGQETEPHHEDVPVRGRGEARLRAKTVFICVYHGWEYHWRLVRQCGGRHRQANCPWHTRTEASVRRGDCSKPICKVALKLADAWAITRIARIQTRPSAICSMYRLAIGDDGVLGQRFLALTRCAQDSSSSAYSAMLGG